MWKRDWAIVSKLIETVSVPLRGLDMWKRCSFSPLRVCSCSFSPLAGIRYVETFVKRFKRV